ncbi:MAG: hypothetical protein J5966_09180 [Lachnospiraceae bacterium]|nr:hypothetical protein [Lachnospiraceae bacterium]
MPKINTGDKVVYDGKSYAVIDIVVAGSVTRYSLFHPIYGTPDAFADELEVIGHYPEADAFFAAVLNSEVTDSHKDLS